MLISLIVYIALIGLLVYLIETFIPMDASFKTGIRIVGGIIVLLLILQALGIPLLGANAL